MSSPLPSDGLPRYIHKDVALLVLREQHGFLTSVVGRDLPRIASRLFSKSIIAQQTFSEVCVEAIGTVNTRTVKLLNDVSKKIESAEDGASFKVFVQAIEDEPSLKKNAEELVGLYKAKLEAVQASQSQCRSTRDLTPTTIPEIRHRPGTGLPTPTGPGNGNRNRTARNGVGTSRSCPIWLYLTLGVGMVVVMIAIGKVYFPVDGFSTDEEMKVIEPIPRNPSADEASADEDKPRNVPTEEERVVVMRPVPTNPSPDEDKPKNGPTAVSCHEIKPGDLDDLFNYVAEIGDWALLCSRLGVQRGTIENLRYSSQASNKMYHCLMAFLDLGKPDSCWENVVRTVCGTPFYKKRLGGEIAKDRDIALPPQCV